MTSDQASKTSNRAICNAVEAAAHLEDDGDTSFTSPSSQLMWALHLERFVESLSEIQPRLVPRPTFASYITSLPSRSTSETLVLVRVTHTALNHVDLLYAHGVHQNNKSGLFKPPFTLGLEFSGIVTESHVVNGVCPFKPGDRVWGGSIGAHAEEIIVPASVLHPLPSPQWSLHDIAALGAATIPVSYGALVYIARLKVGETVLVHAAAGGLGVYAVQIARALGAKVIGTVGSEQKKSFVEGLLHDPKTGGIKEGEGVVNYNSKDWERDILTICKQSGKGGVDVVFDTVGLVRRSIKCTAFNGRIVIVGFAGRTGTGAQKVEGLEQVPVNRLLLKQIKLMGYRFGETGRRIPGAHESIWNGLETLLKQGPEVIRPIIHETYRGLENVKNAMQALSRREVLGKAVIEVQSEEEAMKHIQGAQQEREDGEARSASTAAVSKL